MCVCVCVHDIWLSFISLQRVLLTGDMCYVRSHLYLGPTVNVTKLISWVEDDMGYLLDRYGDVDLLLPGHGTPTYNGLQMVAEDMTGYVNFYLNTLLSCRNGVHTTLQQV